MTVSIQFRGTPIQRASIDYAASLRRRRTGEEVSRSELLLLGAQLVYLQEQEEAIKAGVTTIRLPWPADTQEPA